MTRKGRELFHLLQLLPLPGLLCPSQALSVLLSGTKPSGKVSHLLNIWEKNPPGQGDP